MNAKLLKRVERVMKGTANKNRIRILEYISKENITSVWAISEGLKIYYPNAALHLAKLDKAGLITKFYQGKAVYHDLTSYGEKILEFIKKLE